jgi:uncharacterized membrane protein YbhN (UPF0104 family)
VKTKHFQSVFVSIIGLGLIVAFVYYLYLHADQYRKLLNVSVPGVVMLFMLSLAFPLLNGMQNILLYRNLGAEISYKDGFLLTAASTLANQLPISGGIITKGFYLKRKYNLSYTKFVSSTVALFACFVAANGFVGLGILLYWIFSNKTAVSPILLSAYLLMAACLLIFWLPLDQIKVPEKIRSWGHQAIEGWMLMSRNPALLFKLMGLQFILMVLLSLRYWLAFHMLSQTVTVPQTLLFATASILTQLVSIAPGGLGVREAIVAGVASAIGFDTGISVVAVGLDRLVATITIALTGWVSTVILGKQIAKIALKPEEQEV